MRVRGGRQDDVEHLGAAQLRGEARRLDERRAAGGLAQHGDDVPVPDPAALEVLSEQPQPAVLGHAASSVSARWARSSALTVAGASAFSRWPAPGTTSIRASGSSAAIASA